MDVVELKIISTKIGAQQVADSWMCTFVSALLVFASEVPEMTKIEMQGDGRV